MSAPHARRGFLRGLATLPLIGGSVALIGKPTAAAVPPSPGMMATYLAWLHYEGRVLGHALGTQGLIPHVNPGAHFHDFADMTATAGGAFARAPVVLAAAGCPLTSPEAEEMWTSPLRAVTAGARPPAAREQLLWEYETWLNCEVRAVAQELRPGIDGTVTQFHGPAWEWHRRRPETKDVATRAEMLLATVRCDWRARL